MSKRDALNNRHPQGLKQISHQFIHGVPGTCRQMATHEFAENERADTVKRSAEPQLHQAPVESKCVFSDVFEHDNGPGCLKCPRCAGQAREHGEVAAEQDTGPAERVGIDRGAAGLDGEVCVAL